MTIYRGQGGLGDSYNDPELVHTSGDETVEGVKTFTSTIMGTISGHYTKAETDTKLGLKANQSTTYTKTEVDTLVTAKADQSTTYTKTEVDTALTGKLSTANGSVGTTNLADNAVTNAKLADGSVTNAKIVSVDGAKVTGTIGTSQVSSAVNSVLNVTGSAPTYACRAWVNFNGTGTVAIRASGNVSSITDNGAGDYTVNFTTAMPDADYCPTFGGITGLVNFPVANMATSSFKVRTTATTASQQDALTDQALVCVSVFR